MGDSVETRHLAAPRYTCRRVIHHAGQRRPQNDGVALPHTQARSRCTACARRSPTHHAIQLISRARSRHSGELPMPLASATARLAADAPNYVVAIEAGRHPLTGDEGAHESGQDRGPAPFAFVLSGLAACTAATLRTYMQRKTWPAATIAVEVSLHADHDGKQYTAAAWRSKDRSKRCNARALPKSAKRRPSRSSSSAARASTRRCALHDGSVRATRIDVTTPVFLRAPISVHASDIGTSANAGLLLR